MLSVCNLQIKKEGALVKGRALCPWLIIENLVMSYFQRKQDCIYWAVSQRIATFPVSAIQGQIRTVQGLISIPPIPSVYYRADGHWKWIWGCWWQD